MGGPHRVGQSMSDVAAAGNGYVHGYSGRESQRLLDQASTLAELLHWDTVYPEGSAVLEAGCGVGAQTVTIAPASPRARFLSVERNRCGPRRRASTARASAMSRSSRPICSISRSGRTASTMSSCASCSSTCAIRATRSSGCADC